MLKIKVKDFNLDYSLDSGQVFRFKKIGEIHRGVLGQVVLSLRQCQNALFIEAHPQKSEAEIKHLVEDYFNLEADLGGILNKIDTDSYIHNAIRTFSGLRVINQDIWECLASYIISQRKRIPSIKNNVDFFSKSFGRRIWEDYYSFPRPEDVLKKCQNLKKCRLGYREPYILGAVSKIIKEKIDIESLKSYSTPDARNFLKSFYGVGDKIADCVCLYSLKRFETFPVDTWIRQVMIKKYIKRDVSDQYIRDFAHNRWGEFAGFAQLYLFYYSRINVFKKA